MAQTMQYTEFGTIYYDGFIVHLHHMTGSSMEGTRRASWRYYPVDPKGELIRDSATQCFWVATEEEARRRAEQLSGLV